jgi:hypothetical protein
MPCLQCIGSLGARCDVSTKHQNSCRKRSTSNDYREKDGMGMKGKGREGGELPGSTVLGRKQYMQP